LLCLLISAIPSTLCCHIYGPASSTNESPPPPTRKEPLKTKLGLGSGTPFCRPFPPSFSFGIYTDFLFRSLFPKDIPLPDQPEPLSRKYECDGPCARCGRGLFFLLLVPSSPSFQRGGVPVFGMLNVLPTGPPIWPQTLSRKKASGIVSKYGSFTGCVVLSNFLNARPPVLEEHFCSGRKGWLHSPSLSCSRETIDASQNAGVTPRCSVVLASSFLWGKQKYFEGYILDWYFIAPMLGGL